MAGPLVNDGKPTYTSMRPGRARGVGSDNQRACMDSETLEDVGCCGRLTLILRKSGMSCCCYLFKWFIPFFAFAFGFLIQNILLHVGTYFYVQWMLRLNSKLES